jgi:hypothetical protein
MKPRLLALAFVASALFAAPASSQLAPPPATQASLPIVGTVASAAVLITGIVGQRIYVTSVDLVPVATSVVTFSQGTGAACAGGTASNVTGALTFSAGQHYSKGSGNGAVWVLGLGNSLCIAIGTAAAPGSISYSIY